MPPPMTPKEIEAYWANVRQQFAPLQPVGQAVAYPFAVVGNQVMAGLAGKRKGTSRANVPTAPPPPPAPSRGKPAAPSAPTPLPVPAPTAAPFAKHNTELYQYNPHQAQQDIRDSRAWNHFLRPTLTPTPPARDWYNDYSKTPFPRIPIKMGEKLRGVTFPYKLDTASIDAVKSPPAAQKAQKKPEAVAKENNPDKTHAYTNADYIKWAKKYGAPGATSTSANGPESGINKAAAERAAAAKAMENSTPATEALYKYLFLVDTLRKIDSDPKMAANMDPTAKAALRAMVQAQSQQMLTQAIGSGNAARLADLTQQRSDTNRWGGWTGNAAPGAAAAYMQQMYLPQMTAQHQAALQYAQQNPTSLPNGMSVDAYTNLGTDAFNALQSAPAKQAPLPIPAPIPTPAGSMDATQSQGFSAFDNTTPFTNPYAAAYTV